MKAIVLRETGEPSNLKSEAFPDPVPDDREVIVRLHAAALNRRDVWIRIGKYAGIRFPIILGSDGAGIVSDIGREVDPAIAGREVIINPSLYWGSDPRIQGPQWRILGLPDNGTYAEFVKVPASNVFPKPPHLSFDEAAALPLAALTAYRAVAGRWKIGEGDSVLITGIGGGVACFLFQICKLLGARVFVTSGSDEKIQRAVGLGAEGGVNYSGQNWPDRIKPLTGDAGIDIVIDGAGGENFDKVLDIVRPGGTVILYGASLGLANGVNVRRIFWKQLNVIGSTMGTPDEFNGVLQLINTHKLSPIIDSVYGLEDAAAAHTRMERAEQFGKIVLRIS